MTGQLGLQLEGCEADSKRTGRRGKDVTGEVACSQRTPSCRSRGGVM